MSNLYTRTLEGLIILGIITIVTLTLASTLIRFIPGYGGIYWAEEVSRYVTIWVVFIAGGLGIRYWIHLNVDIMLAQLPLRGQRGMMIFCLLLMMMFEIVLLWFGTKLALANHAQQSASLQMPMSVAYAAIPVGAVIMLYETARLILREWRGEAREALILE
jgi:TRAP-type C4-dicarboxylate transport system permease small subunit